MAIKNLPRSATFYTAGLAVMATELDLPFLYIDLVKGGVLACRYPHEVTRSINRWAQSKNGYKSINPQTKAFLKRRIKWCMSGVATEFISAGIDADVEYYWQDVLSCGSNADMVIGKFDDGSVHLKVEMLKALAVETLATLRRPEIWGKVELLAQILRELPEDKEKLTQREVEKLFKQHDLNRFKEPMADSDFFEIDTERLELYADGREFLDCEIETFTRAARSIYSVIKAPEETEELHLARELAAA